MASVEGNEEAKKPQKLEEEVQEKKVEGLLVKVKKVVGMKEPEPEPGKGTGTGDSGKTKGKSPSEPVKIRKALSAVGFLTLECESETNLSIGSVLQIFNNDSDESQDQKAESVLDSTLFTVDGLAKLLEEKLLPRYERFSMVPNRSSKSWVPPSPNNSSASAIKPPSPPETKGPAATGEENAFDVRNHIHELYLPSAAATSTSGGEARDQDSDRQEVLCEALSKLVSTELDPELPAWEVHIIKNWTRPALFWRIHHCIGDGQSVATALLSISDRAKEIIKVTTKKLPTPPDGFLIKYVDSTILIKLTFYLWIIFGTIAVFLRWAYLHFFFPRPPPLFHRSKVSKEKRVAFDCDAIAVDRVMAVAKHFKVTFNDVMLSCMAGAIGRMMRDQNEEPVEFPISMPVNLRTTPFPKKTGNHIGSYSLYLPTYITDPVKRLRKIHRRTNGMKRLPEQYVTYGMTLICARLPTWASTRIFSSLASHLGAVITNVRGPEQELIYEGQRVHGLIGFVPPPVGVRLGFAVASYAGRVMVSVSGDANLCPDIGQYVTSFIEEFNECEEDFKRLLEQERQPEKEFVGQTWQ